MSHLAIIACAVALPSLDVSSLDNALSQTLGAGGLTSQSAQFDPVALAYYRTGSWDHPLSKALSHQPWRGPAFFDVVQRDAVSAAGQPHKLLAAASRLTNFGSRRDLLGNPAQKYLTRNPNGFSLDQVVERYRGSGRLKGEPTLSGLVPDGAKRAAAIVLDAMNELYPTAAATFTDATHRQRLIDLTKKRAYEGASTADFKLWRALADQAELNYLFAAGQDLAAACDAATTILTTTEVIGSFSYRLPTIWGDVLITDQGAQSTSLSSTCLVLDLGGDDTYTGGSSGWFSLVLDQGGKDSYLSDAGYKGKAVRDGTTRIQQRSMPGPNSAWGGISLLFDESGDDLYRSASPAFGVAHFGISYLRDRSGKDIYDGYAESQGVGLLGIGILEDLGGDDQYRVFTRGQGCGLPAGIGLLIDRLGADSYIAEEEVIDFPSPQIAKHNVSLAQGVGYGVRLDYITGSSLAGGFGFLFDLEGSDSYSAGVFSQGTGYWMGSGHLWDRDGDDQYRSVWYGQGSGAHFAYGYLLDESGADRYEGKINMTQGAGHDFSVGLLVDSSGNDEYFGVSLALGAGNANGFGVLADLGGNDQYTVSGQSNLGQARESAEGSLRQLSLCLGMLFDAEGNDRFNGARPEVRNGARQRESLDRSTAIGIFWDK
jgi:hypothetical protein